MSVASKKKKALTLSIIIPAYNEERHLRTCLESIADQTTMPDQVIVVDNNSIDKTAKIAKEFKFVTLVREKEQGILPARNRGFNTSKTDIIGRIDADTVLPRKWCEKVHDFYAVPEQADQVITGGGFFYNITFPPPKLVGWGLSQIAFRLNRLLMGHYIVWGSNMAMRKSHWLTVKDQVCMRNDIHEDLDLAIHLHRNNIDIAYDASLKVGVVMRRLFRNYHELHGNLLWWPRTLKVHENKRWIVGWIGAYALLIFSPLLLISNGILKVYNRIRN